MILEVVSPKKKYKDDEIYFTLANYCLNAKKMPHGYLATRNVDPDAIGHDMYALSKISNKLKGTRVRHMILSFDPWKERYITPEIAYEIAELVCGYYQYEYQIYGAVHEDKKHLHIHVVMNPVNIITRKKYRGKKEDYYDFLKFLRDVLHEYGTCLYV